MGSGLVGARELRRVWNRREVGVAIKGQQEEPLKGRKCVSWPYQCQYSSFDIMNSFQDVTIEGNWVKSRGALSVLFPVTTYEIYNSLKIKSLVRFQKSFPQMMEMLIGNGQEILILDFYISVDKGYRLTQKNSSCLRCPSLVTQKFTPR